MKYKKSCLIYIPLSFNKEIHELQYMEWVKNGGKQKRTKADQIIRLAQIGMKTLKTKKV